MIQSHMSESHWHRFPDRITIFVTVPVLLSSAWFLFREPPAEYASLDYGNDSEKNIGLFAYKLSFPHPITHELISFSYIPTNKPFNLFELKNVNKS